VDHFPREGARKRDAGGGQITTAAATIVTSAPLARVRVASAGHPERLHVVHLARRVAHVDVDPAVTHHEAPAVVVEADVLAVEPRADRRPLARVQRHALEAAQPAHRLREARDRVAQVQLGDLVTRP
jgi:hypothetical protein